MLESADTWSRFASSYGRTEVDEYVTRLNAAANGDRFFHLFFTSNLRS